MLTLTLLGVVMLGISAHFSGPLTKIDQGMLVRAFASRRMLAAVFAITFVVLWCSWGAWNPIPVVHDELAYVLQAQIYARGHWSLPSPPLPLFWEQPHVLTEPRLVAKYFPGHPLLLTIGVLLGWNALMPLVLQSTCAVLVFVLARRIASGAVAFMTWIVWLFSAMVLYFGASFYSEATTTVCWLAGWYALLEWRETRYLRWLVLVALFTGWDAIARPLTGVAYALPIAVVVLRDVFMQHRWKQLAVAFAVGAAVIAIVPLWSALTTGDWSVTPLTLYTREYMPYDAPGFGLITTPPAHTTTPDLQQLNNVYSSVHVNHYPSTLLNTLGERAQYLAVSVWGTWNGVLIVFAALGLLTLGPAGAVAVGTGVVLLLTYLVFATPAQWTLYYYETMPGYAFLTASGLAWAAALAGRPRGELRSEQTRWTSPRWSRALVTASLIFVLPGIGALASLRNGHRRERRKLVQFATLLRSIHDKRVVMFVRYKGNHDPHVTFVRNVANLDTEQIWVVYDRGDAENARLLKIAAGRKAFLFDELQGKTYVYDPAPQP